MKLCKNEYTIWASLKKLKSSRENGETGRYQNDKRWEMVDFCGSPWVPTWPFDLRGPGFIPDQGLKSHRPNSTFKKKFFFAKCKVTERGDVRDLLCLQKYAVPFFVWPVLQVLEPFQFSCNTCHCAFYALRACCVHICGICFGMENDCNIDPAISEMILNFDT